MNAVGVIAEYNPLHNGHVYHLEEARRLAGRDAVVVAMSGNYMQRGEPAILDKWTRSRHAVSHGADLVIEIPALFSLGNAGQYAKAGVDMLESLGCVKNIAFGSEIGNIETIKHVARNLSYKRIELRERISTYSGKGYSFPAARELAYRDIFKDYEKLDEDITVLSGSNDILGLEYVTYCNSAEPIAIKRRGAVYNSEPEMDAEFQSAAAIRNIIKSDFNKCENDRYPYRENEKLLKAYVPGDVLVDLYKISPSSSEKWFELIRYAIISTDVNTMEKCPSGGEGLGNKLKQCISDVNDLDELILSVKSKKYTYTRIQRLCAQLVLGITNDQLNNTEPQYIRVLAFNDVGRALLSEIKKSERNRLPIITNIARESGKLDREALDLVHFEAKSCDIYNAVKGLNLNSYSDYRQNPSKQCAL